MPHLRTIPLGCAALMLSAAMLSVSCGGGGDASKAPGSAGTEPTHALVTILGTEAVVLPMSAALASDTIELARLTGYTQAACTTDASAHPTAPPCREGETDGSKIDVLASLGCNGSWIRPELVPDAYRAANTGHPTLFAVYRPKRVAGSFGADLGIQQVVVVQTDKRADGSPTGFALHIKNGRVVMLQSPCDLFFQLVRSDVVDSYIVDPTKASPTAQ